jgi:hypothetical protein
MGTYDALFKTIEEYEGITIEALQYSKIGKGEVPSVSLVNPALITF